MNSSQSVHRVNVNFSPEAYAALTTLAARSGRTISEVIRRAIALEVWFDQVQRDGARVLVERAGSISEVVPR